MSSYGLIAMILAFYVGGGTATIRRVHTGDAQVRVPLETIFSFNNFIQKKIIIIWKNRYFLQVAKNRKNDCLCF